MKRGFVIIILALILLAGIVSAEACDIGMNLLNQDPYPATPGEYVKVVFQVNGTENPECGKIEVTLLSEYPFSLDADANPTITMIGGSYVNDYSSFLLAPYKIRVDSDALDGDNKIRVQYRDEDTNTKLIKDFYINVEDARTDFNVMIDDYSKSKKLMTFSIVNVGDDDAEALVLEVKNQDNFKIEGGGSVIIGSLNSNDDTTASVQGVPQEGEINVNISYNDANHVRRTLEKKVVFTSAYLLKEQAEARSNYFYLFWTLILVFVLYIVYGIYKKRKARDHKNMMLMKR